MSAQELHVSGHSTASARPGCVSLSQLVLIGFRHRKARLSCRRSYALRADGASATTNDDLPRVACRRRTEKSDRVLGLRDASPSAATALVATSTTPPRAHGTGLATAAFL